MIAPVSLNDHTARALLAFIPPSFYDANPAPGKWGKLESNPANFLMPRVFGDCGIGIGVNSPASSDQETNGMPRHYVDELPLPSGS